MLMKEELVAIRAGFASRKWGFYELCAQALGELVKDHVKSKPAPIAYVWLIGAVFPRSKTAVFMTAKDAHVHVMTALDTLVFIAQ
jgi:hypothetical protein